MNQPAQPDNATQARVLEALRQAHQRLDELESAANPPVAVVGIGCRLPGGVSGPEQFWQLLGDGVDAVAEVPPARWDIDEWYDADPDAPGKMYTREGAFVDDVAGFDPEFFRISPREALKLDPQQRLLLEVCWEALEHAGINPESVRGSMTGFFMGLSWHDYERNAFGMNAESIDAYSGMGNTPSIAVGRLAYVLGAHGPTAQIDTACSASLTSVHLACQALQRGDASMMLAGGVNLMISPLSTVFCSKIKALSPDGRCKTYDESADGYGRGEGCGVVVLKRLDDAVKDGDTILAVIKGSAMNQDGPSSGLTVPSRSAQVRVIEAALQHSGIAPHDVSYIEAHGTGTALGDPIEIGALADALGKQRGEDKPLYVGSVKTNIGHLEAAAGVAGLIKAVLSIHKQAIPAHLHFNKPSSRIDWDAAPIRVPTALIPWPGSQRVAGVSSFGFSGTNAHVVLEQFAQEPRVTPVERESELLCLSARSASALRDMAGRYAQALENPATSLGDLCLTANAGRASFPERLYATATDNESMRGMLSRFAEAETGNIPGIVTHSLRENRRRKTAFLFTGQGSQWQGMGQSLYESQPVFRAAMQRCDHLLRDALTHSLLSVLYNDGVDPGLVNQTSYTQPALFALEWSLYELWRAWGIEPGRVMGHSVGEYVAACAAGVFSLEDGLRLIAARGRLMQALPRNGSMLAVLTDQAQVRAVTSNHADSVSIAAINGPANVVIAGLAESVAQCGRELTDSGVKVVDLSVSHAFHSPLMEPMLDEFESIVASVDLSAPALPVVSNVTGQVESALLCEPAYWRRHIRETVDFAAGMRTLHESGTTTYLELGPAPVLLDMGRACVDDTQASWVPSLRRNGAAWTDIQAATGQLWQQGHKINWAGYAAGFHHQRIAAPTYPFQRKRYWVDPVYSSGNDLTINVSSKGLLSRAPLVDRLLTSSLLKAGESLFETRISAGKPAFLAEHRVFDQLIPPATFFHELALEAAAMQFDEPVALSNVSIQKPLLLDEQGSTVLQCLLVKLSATSYSYRISSYQPGDDESEGAWVVHAIGEILRSRDAASALLSGSEVAKRGESGINSLQSADVVQRFAEQGLDLGSTFHTLQDWRFDGDAVVATLALDESLHQNASAWQFHPALLDALGQSVGLALATESTELYLPVAVDTLCVIQAGLMQATLRARLREVGADSSLRIADIDVFATDGNLAAQVRGLTLRAAPRERVLPIMHAAIEDNFYSLEWLAQQHAQDALPAASGVLPGRKNWLIIDDDEGLGAAVGKLMEEAGQYAVSLKYHHGSLALADCESAINHLGRAASTDIGGVIMLSTKGLPGDFAQPEDRKSQPHTIAGDICGDLLHAVQALGGYNLIHRTRLVYVTRGAQQFGPNSGFESLAQATASGLLANTALEFPLIDVIHLDLDSGNNAPNADMVVAEALTRQPESKVISQDHKRLVARLAPVENAEVTSVVGHIDPSASYLVTGGLGGIGMTAVEWLLDNGATHIGLLGRSEPDDVTRQRLDALETPGVRIETIACDAGDHDALASAIDALLAANDTELRGILHFAGTLDDGLLASFQRDSFESVMLSKVSGAWNLHQLSLDHRVDFFLMASSAAAVIGSAGQGNYAAANSFLSALAQYRQYLNLPATTVAFGPWENLGMTAAMDKLATRRMMGLGWQPVPVDSAGAVFDRLLQNGRTDVALLPLDWSAFLQQFAVPDGEPQVPSLFASLDWNLAHAEAGSSQQASSLLASLKDADAETKQALIYSHIKNCTTSVLQVQFDSAGPDAVAGGNEAANVSDKFTDFGLDSLMHMELRIAVTKPLGLSIPVGEFLGCVSMTSLAKLVTEKLVAQELEAITIAEEDIIDEEMDEFTL